MNLADVVAEIREALDTIPGLLVPEWGAQRVTPPAALVMLPEQISYDETYGRGTDRYPDVQVLVLVPNPTTYRAVQDLAPYTDGTGARSVKRAIEAYPYTACDAATVHVGSCEFEPVKFAGVDYLAAVFHIDLAGPGE